MSGKQVIKSILFKTLNLWNEKKLLGASILMYHSVGDNGIFSTVSPHNFEKQLQFLKKSQYKVIPLSRLVERLHKDESVGGYVSITFDDGYSDTYTTAFPLLKKYELPATVFVIPDLLGKVFISSSGVKAPVMSLGEAQEMYESGLIEIMPHGVTHRELPPLTLNEAVKEIESSQDFIKKEIGSSGSIFAYPRGKYSDEIINYFKQHEDRWLGAVTVDRGIIHSNPSIFRLPRNSIDSTASFEQFKASLCCSIEWYEKMKKWV